MPRFLQHISSSRLHTCSKPISCPHLLFKRFLLNISLTESKGRAVKVGDKVKDIKVGDRVGVGAQVGADLNCDNCKADQENYCPNQ
jgi:threonine dehydrogenase-like Zn-dependent dehydrogenase